MKNPIFPFLIIILLTLPSCSSLVDDLNSDPNNISADDVEAASFLTGAMLANTSFHCGHTLRITGLYSGQLVGYSSLYATLYGYNISTIEMDEPWSTVYVGVIPNARQVRQAAPNDRLLQGIAKTVEAMAISTTASLFGDVPYSQINGEVKDANFDNQWDVLLSVLSLLDEAVADFGDADSRLLTEDIHFQGDAEKWEAAAHTLKARIFMWLKDYGNAYLEAQQGINSIEGSLQFHPQGDANVNFGDKNLFYELTFGPRSGELGTRESYLMSLLDPNHALYRGNNKTVEDARFGYYSYDENNGGNNLGFANAFEPMDILSYQENQLILAEAGLHINGKDKALEHLNEYRAFLNEGGRLNDHFRNEAFIYLPYVLEDFDAGGMENMDGISNPDALLREIIEERFVSGFGTFMPFDDARRLRKDHLNLSVPFPLNTANVTAHPERFPYAEIELNNNANAPTAVPSIFEKTRVNL